MIVLETERLLFRVHTLADLEPFSAMEADHKVLRYVLKLSVPSPVRDAGCGWSVRSLNWASGRNRADAREGR
jgi:hypothetical protein